MDTRQIVVSLLVLVLGISCEAQSCPGQKFPCDDKRCIPGSWRCDGVFDCKDRTDEKGCDITTCAAKYWRCTDGRCVPQKWRCDGQSDCADSSDEENCDLTTTSTPEQTTTSQPVLTPIEGASLLLVAMSQQLDMFYLTKQNTRVGPIRTMRGMFGRLMGVDVHISSRSLCWADNDKKTVSCGHLSEDLDITKVRVLYSPRDGAVSPVGVAIDWTHRLVYWTDQSRGHIIVGSLEATWKGQKTLVFDAQGPTYIIVDPRNRWIFVVEESSTKIIRYSSTGSDRRELVGGNIERLTGLALDLTLDRVFWLDTRKYTLTSCGMYGGDRQVHKRLSSTGYSGLEVFTDHNKTHLICGMNPSGKVVGYTLGSKQETLLADHWYNGRSPDMALFDPVKQPHVDNQCEGHDCTHICLPKMFGGYVCACPEWLSLSEDGKMCQYKDSFWERPGKCRGSLCECSPPATRFGDKCRYEDILIVGTDDQWEFVKTFPVEQKELSHPCRGQKPRSFAADVKASVLWWIHGTTIYSSDVGRGPALTSCERVFSEGLVDPRALALDWVNRNLYWSDSGLHAISVVSLATRIPTTLVSTGLGEVRGIAVDPIRGWFYWTNWGNHMSSKVERSWLDGSNRQQVVTEGLHTPSALVIDFESRRLLIGDPVLQAIVSCTLEGANCFSLSVSKRASHLTSIAVLGQYVYWSDEGFRAVYRMRKDDGKDKENVDDFMFTIPGAIAIFHPRTQPNGTPVCGSNNGGCLICLPTRDSSKPYKCACPDGTVVSQDGRTCNNIPTISCDPGYHLQDGKCVDVNECSSLKPCAHTCKNTAGSFVCNCRIGYKKVNEVSCELRGPAPRMLVVDGRRIHLLDGFHNTKVRSKVLAWPQHYAKRRMIAVDVDVAGGRIFWAQNRAIKQADLQDGRVISPRTVLNSSVGFPESLAYDWIHNSLYWTNSRGGRIGVVTLPKGFTRTVHKRLHKPRALALDPARGAMYWTTWQRSPAIHKSNLGGTHRSVVIATKNRWPNGLTIDYSERRLYWTDGRASALFSADLSGRNSRVVVMRHTNKPQLMFSVAVMEDYVYWTDWREMFLSRVRRNGGDIETFNSPAVRRPTDVKVIHSSRQIPSTTACSSNNGGCTHFCTAAPYGTNPVSCKCPDNMVLDDDKYTCKIPKM